ncbi:hypothetical protein CAEBREN_08700 [Caenorhabditis brenneri]|uniref:Uncharacterized protein n=1 Tax=Caenorhabditis brenneri TaxID=135651 RepID=G0MA86_CAEBE|nr:hypothetical protein CAEBREN_08700 [Caenorhabditis brenneri]
MEEKFFFGYLYSNRVIRPLKFRVWNHKTIYRDHELVRHCDLRIKFDDGRALEWNLKYTPPGSSYSHPEGPVLSFKIGAKNIKAIIDDPDEKNFTLHTNLTRAWSSRFGIIRWLTKTFRCEVDEIHFGNELKYHFDDLNNWDQLESVRSLHIDSYDDSKWLQTFLSARKNKNLKTSIHRLNYLQQLPLCLLKSIEVNYITSNLSALNQDDFIEYASAALKCTKEMVEFNIPNFTADQVNIFRSRLNLSDDIQPLNEHYKHHCYREKEMNPTSALYSIRDNGTAFVYYFLGETPGIIDDPDEECFTLHTDLTDTWDYRFEIVEWLTKTFRCEIDELNFQDDLKYHFNDLDEWDLDSVQSLGIKSYDDSEWLQTLLSVRKNKNLKTSIDILNYPQPLPLCFLKSIEVSFLKSNLSALSQDDFIEYASAALKCSKGMVEFNIPNFTAEKVNIFRSRLNLSDDIQSLNEHYEHCNYREKEMNPTSALYSIRNNDTAFVYYFLGKTPGVFDELLRFVRKAKPQPVQ